METRNTLQRSLVMEADQQLCHPTAEQVYAYISARHPAVSRGTVYRNLRTLAEAGRIRRVPMPEGADRFDRTTAQHYHIHCRLCGRMADVDMPGPHMIPVSAMNTHGYLVEGHELLLSGVCPSCRER